MLHREHMQHENTVRDVVRSVCCSRYRAPNPTKLETLGKQQSAKKANGFFNASLMCCECLNNEIRVICSLAIAKINYLTNVTRSVRGAYARVQPAHLAVDTRRYRKVRRKKEWGTRRRVRKNERL